MNAQDLAAKLNGCQYMKEISKELEAQAKAAGLVVVFGGSDDLIQFRGAIHDEVGASGGGTALLSPDGLLVNACQDDECPHFAQLKKRAARIEAQWCVGDEHSWTYSTAIPHTTFEVLEDDQPPYCLGIVFALSDVKMAA